MRTRTSTSKLGAFALATSAMVLTGSPSFAAEYWLRAGPTTVSVPDSVLVPMWGYALCAPAFASCTDPITVPGPALNLPAGDTTLTVHLRNDLAVPTSIVVNGMSKPMAPVWTDGTPGARTGPDQRVRSFDAEAAPGAIADYTWQGVKPGTYLYQSGTHPQVQVQMGLYGAVTKNAVDAVVGSARAQAYPGTAYGYDNQATLLYSEIDPELHAAVQSGSYGTSGPTSTIDYTPRYFLINGQPYPLTSVIEPVGAPGTTLVRMLNAGLTTRVPMILGKYWNVIAEDGKAYSYNSFDGGSSTRTAKPMLRSQYTALLTAAKTIDVLVPQQAGGPGLAPIVDRRLGLSNDGAPDGGMLAYLSIGPASGGGTGGGVPGSGTGSNEAPVAVADSYDSVRGVTLNVAAPGVLFNDTDANPGQSIMAAAVANGTTVNGGTYTLNANGSFIFSPAPAYAGLTDSFSYRAVDPHGVASNLVDVTISLPVPVMPAAALLDNFDVADGLLSSSWSQANNTGGSPDVQIVSNTAQATSIDLGGLALWNTSFGTKQVASFQSSALDRLALVLKATGGTTTAPANLIRVRREASTGKVVVSTLIGSIGAPVYVEQAAFSAAGSGTLTASVDDKGLVLVWLNGTYLGGVQLPDVAVWKGTGRIGVQLQTVGGSVDNFSGGSL